MKRAGLEAIFIGLESFSPKDLKIYCKNITPSRMEETLDLLIEHNILRHIKTEIPRVMSQYNYPDFQSSEIEQLNDFVQLAVFNNNALNVNFFKDILSMFLNEESEILVRNHTEEYLFELQCSLDTINGRYAEFNNTVMN